MSVGDSLFEENSGSIGGAILLIDNQGPVLIYNSIFARNDAFSNDSSLIFAGGGITLHELEEVAIIQNCQFIGNFATSGKNLVLQQ